MGGQTSEPEEAPLPTVGHPKFHKVKFIKNNEVMRTTLSLDNYSDFAKWEEQLLLAAKFDDDILLLPKAYECNRQAVCGSAAILNVRLPSTRSSSITIHTSYKRNSRTAASSASTSTSKKSGTYCSVCAGRLMTSCR